MITLLTIALALADTGAPVEEPASVEEPAPTVQSELDALQALVESLEPVPAPVPDEDAVPAEPEP